MQSLFRLGFVLWSCSWILLGQAPACPAKGVLSTALVDVRLAGGGSGIKDLQAKDFLIQGKGLLGGVEKAEAELPLDLVVLIESFDRQAALSGAAALLVSELHPEDRVAVFTYGTGVQARTKGWEQDHGLIGEAMEHGGRGVQVQQVRPLSAIVEALKLFPETPEAGRKRVMLLIGDEQDWSSPMRIEAVLAALQAKKVTLSVVIDPPRGRVMGKILPKINVTPGNIGEPRAGEQQGRFGAQSVAKVAVASGGDAMAPNGVWALEEMITRFHERYLLSYCAEKKHASKPVAVELQEEAKKKTPPFQLHFAKSLL